jgi:hypothetical protein
MVMLFPKPMSAKLLVRRTLAKNISGIADLYGAVVSGVEDEAEVNVGAEWKMNVKERQGRYRAMFLKCLVSCQRFGGLAAVGRKTRSGKERRGIPPAAADLEFISREQKRKSTG